MGYYLCASTKHPGNVGSFLYSNPIKALHNGHIICHKNILIQIKKNSNTIAKMLKQKKFRACFTTFWSSRNSHGLHFLWQDTLWEQNFGFIRILCYFEKTIQPLPIIETDLLTGGRNPINLIGVVVVAAWQRVQCTDKQYWPLNRC